MPAKAGSTLQDVPEPLRSNAPERDLSHIRVGPQFLSKVDGACPECGESTLERTCVIIENGLTKKKLAMHSPVCLDRHPELKARQGLRSRPDLGSFLDGRE